MPTRNVSGRSTVQTSRVAYRRRYGNRRHEKGLPPGSRIDPAQRWVRFRDLVRDKGLRSTLYSSQNTSPVGTVKFGASDPATCYAGMNLGLAVILAMSLGIMLTYREHGLPAGIATAATGIGLWLWYHKLVNGGTSQGPFPPPEPGLPPMVPRSIS